MSDELSSQPEPGGKTPAGDEPQPAEQRAISLGQLSEAFAEMLRTGPQPPDPTAGAAAVSVPASSSGGATDDEAVGDRSVTPRNLLEAMLFVGSPTGEPLSRDRVASLIRGVPPSEVDELVRQLNEIYERDGSPYEIVHRGAGYELVLRPAFASVRERFYGRTREARLSQAAIEVLAIVAYRGPVTAEQVGELRGMASGQVLAQLVRRQLLRIERPETKPRRPVYLTTDRFLHLFGLEKRDDLPQSEDLDSR